MSGQEGYDGCCYQNEQGDWKVDGKRSEEDKKLLESWVMGDISDKQESLALLSSVRNSFEQANSVSNKKLPSYEILRRNEAVRAKMTQTPIEQLKAEKRFISAERQRIESLV